ncbi:uncharacterized protein LOC142345795 isoform X2 [Convolutriloba macropyga]|uniref:uncharacterized protein LOC142345795 isoform X2 n=1 Tax=Convolutriloba macropyga TaxID=536237 RepID=UPI003F528D11
MAAPQYFVIVEGGASGIYNSLSEAEAKLQLNNLSGAPITKVLRFTTLLDAFNCLQAHRSSQSQPDKTLSSQNEEKLFKRDESKQIVESFSSDTKLSRDTETCKKELGVYSECHFRPPKPKEEAVLDGSEHVNGSSKSNLPPASELGSLSRSRDSSVVNTIPKKYAKKECKPKTRNVCIQAERTKIICPECKGQTKKKTPLIDNGTQTKSSKQYKCVQIQTTLCTDLNECICCMASEVSKIRLEQINWEFALSSKIPMLESLLESCVRLRPASGCGTDWYLRHDWFSLKATIPSNRIKAVSNKGAQTFKSPFGAGLKRRQSTLVLKKAIKTAVQSPRGATGCTKGYKIPKKRKVEANEESESKDEFSDAMDMDWIQCTQARLDDVTYDSRDIPHDTVNLDYEQIFKDYLSKSVTHVIVEDAYIQLNHQIQNLVRFSNMLIKRTSLKKLDLNTCRSARGANEQLQMLQEFKACLKESRNVEFTFQFDNRLHDRIIKFSNGWSVCLGRGLDYFQKSVSMLDRNDMSLRRTRAFRVITYKSNPF